MDGSEELLHVQLDDGWVLSLGQDLEQILVTKEVKTRELATLQLQIVIQCFLATLLLFIDRVQSPL